MRQIAAERIYSEILSNWNMAMSHFGEVQDFVNEQWVVEENS